ncbi:hypothetical protein ACFX2J_017798 [Malus domestica]
MKSSHTVRASSFFQKLLCREKDERRVICLPCHQYLITDKMAQQLARIFSNSLKFGNFFLMLSQQMFSALEASQAYID